MKKSFLLYTGIAAAMVLTSSCRKYVEIDQVQTRVLSQTSDYEGLLNNTNVMLATYSYPMYASDDGGADTVTWQNTIATNANGNAYIWAEKIIPNATTDDNDWVTMYKAIYYTNLVIENIGDATGGTDADKSRIMAEAKINRAFYYLTLVNIYAKPYDSTTAASDLGVPLRDDDLVTGSLARVPVQQIYNLILSDLKDALGSTSLPALPAYTYEASQAGAYGLLARTYLYMRNFSAAEDAAKKALQLQSTLLNLNNYTASLTAYPLRHYDPEVLFLKMATSPNAYPLSNSMRAVYTDSTTDLRYVVLTSAGVNFATSYSYLSRVYSKTKIIDNGYVSGPTVPEMLLIQAECEARAGNAAAAMTPLNTLRKQRYTPAGYADLTATDAATAMQLVITERRKELANTGHRWFDLRRLTKDGLTPTLTKTLKGVTYTLEPGSNRYTFAIADKYVSMNPEIIQNPR